MLISVLCFGRFSIVSSNPNKKHPMYINGLRLATQIIALELEINTNNQMRLTSKTPRSVLSMVKREYGFRGSKVKVLAQLKHLKELFDQAILEGKTEISI